MGDLPNDPFNDIPGDAAGELPELDAKAAATGWASLSFSEQLTSDKLGSSNFWFTSVPGDDVFAALQVKADPKDLVPAEQRVHLGTVAALAPLVTAVDITDSAFPSTAKCFAFTQERSGILFAILSSWENALAEASASLPSEAARKALNPYLLGLNQLGASKDGQGVYQ